MAFFYILILIAWLLPGAISLRILHDGAERTAVRTDRRTLLAVALNWLAAWMLWFRSAGPFGPVSQVLRLARHTASYQSLMVWVYDTGLCLLVGVAVGTLLRGVTLRRESTSRGCRNAVLLLIAAAVLVLLLCFSFAADGAGRLSLQELCRREHSAGQSLSYAILKNDGALPNELRGVYLDTDSGDSRHFAVPEQTLAPGATLRVEAEDDLFLSISGAGGDTVRLSNSYGNELDSVTLPTLETDAAYRRTNGSWSVVRLNTITGASEVAAPGFSAVGGFYDAPFELTLSAGMGTEIYYTLDGSTPGTDDTPYTGAIRVYDRSAEPNRYRSIRNVQDLYSEKEAIGVTPVDKAFVVRAVAIDADGNRSDVVTQTYFVGLSDYADGAVLSLVADPDDLFGENGIYVTGADYDEWYERYHAAAEAGQDFDEAPPEMNYELRGPESERPAALELFEQGSEVLAQPVGIRIQGNTSRDRVLKRFSVYSRAAYGTGGLFGTELFAGKRTHSFMLRDGVDSLISHAVGEGRDVAVLRARPVRVFLNGEFWYDINMVEKYSGNYFSQTFGVYKEDVEIIAIGAWTNATEAEKRAYEALLAAARERDMSDPEQYAAFCAIADVQSYIDYCCLNVYLGNADSHERLNTCVWRTKVDEFTEYGDGRWRWALSDMDLQRSANRVNGEATNAEINSFTAARNENWPPLLRGGTLYESLKRSPDFRRQFVLTFMDLVNTTFSEANMSEVLARFGQTLEGYDKGFFRDRAGYITRYLAEEFDLTGTQETITLRSSDADAGTVTLNTVTPDLASGAWTGSYYTDYPVTLTATPADGRAFDHWEVDGVSVSGEMIEVTLQEGGTIIHAIFR